MEIVKGHKLYYKWCLLSLWSCCYGDFFSLPFIRGVQIELVVCVSELFVGSINQSLGAKRPGPTVSGGLVSTSAGAK